MEVSVSNADRYWNLLKDLSNEMKLDLIARLSNSMRQEKKEHSVSASRFYGAWRDTDSLDADKLAEEVKKARTEYEEAQKTYADYRDGNQNLSTRKARLELYNLNVDRRLAYNTYRQRMMQMNRAKENLYRKFPVLTVVHPAEVPQRPVAPWTLLGWCLLWAVIGTISWVFLKRRAFKLRFKKLKRPTIRRPLLFGKRLSL